MSRGSSEHEPPRRRSEGDPPPRRAHSTRTVGLTGSSTTNCRIGRKPTPARQAGVARMGGPTCRPCASGRCRTQALGGPGLMGRERAAGRGEGPICLERLLAKLSKDSRPANPAPRCLVRARAVHRGLPQAPPPEPIPTGSLFWHENWRRRAIAPASGRRRPRAPPAPARGGGRTTEASPSLLTASWPVDPRTGPVPRFWDWCRAARGGRRHGRPWPWPGSPAARARHCQQRRRSSAGTAKASARCA